MKGKPNSVRLDQDLEAAVEQWLEAHLRRRRQPPPVLWHRQSLERVTFGVLSRRVNVGALYIFANFA
jgi:hypothetical protein